MTPSYPGYPDMGVPAIPGGGYAIPSPTPSSYGAPIQYSSSMGCLGGGSTLGTPMPIYGSGIPQMTSPVGEYPTIAPPALPTAPGTAPLVMPFDRPATPTPAPPSIIEDRKQSMTSIANVGSNANRGTVIVRVPTDAKLFAEGRQLTVTNGEKTFTTPPIPSDRDAIYTFRTEYVRDGEVITQTKKVNVRAGGQAVVTFEDLLTRTEKKASAELFAGKSFTPYPTFPVIPLPAVPTGLTAYPTIKPPATEERARITVKLPPSTILYVDGKKSDRTDSIREFLTPVLKPGQDYSYMMRTEPMSGNLGAGQELKIEFRSGQAMLVDFTNPTNPLQPSQNLTAGK